MYCVVSGLWQNITFLEMAVFQHTFADIPEIGRFPSTRYRGSKRKLVPWIHASLKHLAFDTAIDIFGGTGSVSYLFKKMGKSVTYNDILKFNYKTGKALVANDNVTLDDSEILRLIERAANSQSPGIISKNFRDFYFTAHENKWLDAIISSIQPWSRDLPSPSIPLSRRNMPIQKLA
jgi:adenine-specific DNA methylase